ncbi:MAG: hypothetical protein A2677_01530 [Candidatus Komeilibacteria bacterium RIFCSPHIGHO2_01_FULL_52_14]|uniref:Uncharacterized protein n=2 Tax=Candidatus Komeiliibacteriota TaxID=1817908 RepID=A0A1G2BN21_9BACT|nr:MAG: hypothetical protein A2677_01530 [Candidatus Komeilibacteria bacterium RIFCSPHIGHO2_01_FULL_52_14]
MHMFHRKSTGADQGLLFWKRMVNGWSLVAFMIFVLHFFSRGYFKIADSLISVLYPAILTIYTGQKEFSRWRSNHFSSRFFGEWFVLFWTLVFMLFVIVSVLSRGTYQVSLEMTTTYLAVVTIYAVTLKSKQLHSRR